MSKYRIPFFKPLLTKAELYSVESVLDSGHLTTGEKTNALANEIKKITNMEYVFCVSSATAGLHLSLEALRLKPGSRVALPVWTYVATAHAIEQAGYTPIFSDVHDDYTIDHDGSDCDAILPVNIGGMQYNNIVNNIIVEDMAHGFPAAPHNSNAIGVYSFHANKMITTAEGGAIITNNGEYADYIKNRIYFGIEKTCSTRYDVVSHGYKYNMSDIHAAIGLVQIGRIHDFIGTRKYIADIYNYNLDQQYMILPYDREIWYLYQIRLILHKISITRDDVIKLLATDYNIETSVHFEPLHMKSYYKIKYGLYNAMFPTASQLFNETLSLPLWPGMQTSDALYVCDAINNICKEYSND